MVICDTSGLLAAFDRSDPDHAAAASSLGAARPPRLVSPYVVAELDHLLRRQLGHGAARAALDRLTSGAYELACLSEIDLKHGLTIDRLHADFGIGVTDASLLVLAALYKTRDLLTF